MRLLVPLLILLLAAATCRAQEAPQFEEEAPRVRALLEQAWSAESGKGYMLDPQLALALYCHAGLSGSSEGFFRLGRLLIQGPSDLRNVAKGRGYLALASQLGHQLANEMLGDTAAIAPEPDNCTDFETVMAGSRFNMGRYVAGLAAPKQSVVEIIKRDAPKFDVPAALALAIACAESNFNSRAVSPKNAQGVMQLIPDTQKRFGVNEPFDPQQNVRGGLRYLKWLLAKFSGNLSHVAAAYNAGEGAVLKYKGVPPYAETRAYVKRVLFYAGLAAGTAGLPQKAAPPKGNRPH